jgi:hypothetical protein
MYDETIEYLRAKGFGGFVDQLYDYKNDMATSRQQEIHTPTSNTADKNESPAGSPILNGGASSLEVL